MDDLRNAGVRGRCRRCVTASRWNICVPLVPDRATTGCTEQRRDVAPPFDELPIRRETAMRWAVAPPKTGLYGPSRARRVPGRIRPAIH